MLPRALPNSDCCGIFAGQSAAPVCFFPTTSKNRARRTLLRRQLGRDFEQHRFWLIVDSLGFVASGALFLLPGPNFVAYYFAFRMVGHYLSLRGARQGLDAVQWTSERSAPLSELRRAMNLEVEMSATAACRCRRRPEAGASGQVLPAHGRFRREDRCALSEQAVIYFER